MPCAILAISTDSQTVAYLLFGESPFSGSTKAHRVYKRQEIISRSSSVCSCETPKKEAAPSQGRLLVYPLGSVLTRNRSELV